MLTRHYNLSHLERGNLPPDNNIQGQYFSEMELNSAT